MTAQPTSDARFWDRAARKYAASKIGNPAAYEATLERIGSYLSPAARVLEIGCGTGSTALRLAPGVTEYLGTDASPGMIAIAREKLAAAPVAGLRFEVAGVGDLPEGAVDAVLGFSLLHLVPDLDAALAAARARLGPGGLLITKTVCLAEMSVFLRLVLPAMRLVGKAPRVVHFFRTEDLTAAMGRAGFEIVESRTFAKAPKVRFVVARVPG